MKWTIVLFATVVLGGALAFLLVMALPVWADPVNAALLPPFTETDGGAGA